jgi:hypothetical protein
MKTANMYQIGSDTTDIAVSATSAVCFLSWSLRPIISRCTVGYGPSSMVTGARSQSRSRAAFGLWLFDDFIERDGRTDPSQSYAGNPDDGRGAPRLDACALGGEGRRSGRPHDARIVARGADKEDRAAA